MNSKTKVGIALLAAAALAGGAWWWHKKHSEPAVTVTLRISVSPAEQLGFVAGRGNSAQFKYLMGKQSGVKPVLAQKLALKPVPNTAMLEARVGVLTKDEGKHYADAFVPTLQGLCGRQAQLSLTSQLVR